MNAINGMQAVCIAVGLLSATGCVSIHNEYPVAPANEEPRLVETVGQAAVPVQPTAPVQVAVPVSAETTMQTVVVEQVPAPDAAPGAVDILKDAKKPCSSVADDAGEFKNKK